METMNNFIGTGVALTTPFNKSKEIDYNSLEKLIEHVIKGGVNYLVLFGTTGESSTISFEEKKEAVKIVNNIVKNRVPLVLGFGGNNTYELVKQIEKFDFQGVSAILSVCPYYNKPNQEGIYLHYKHVCTASPVPVILYNVPGRTVINMHYHTTIRIAQEFNKVVAIKEATDNLDNVMDLIYHKPQNLMVIAGDDALALPFVAIGANGVISVVANAFPELFSSLIKSALNGDFQTAREYHYKLLPLMHTLLQVGNPSGIKAVLNIIGICEYEFRLPVHGVTNEQFKAIERETLKLLIH